MPPRLLHGTTGPSSTGFSTAPPRHHGSSKRGLLHGTTASSSASSSMAPRLLEARAPSWHHDSVARRWCGSSRQQRHGLLQGVGHSTVWPDFVVALQGTTAARPNDGMTSQGTTMVWLRKRHGILHVASAQAPPMQWWCGRGLHQGSRGAV
jgi:hypothetical protein